MTETKTKHNGTMMEKRRSVAKEFTAKIYGFLKEAAKYEYGSEQATYNLTSAKIESSRLLGLQRLYPGEYIADGNQWAQYLIDIMDDFMHGSQSFSDLKQRERKVHEIFRGKK